MESNEIIKDYQSIVTAMKQHILFLKQSLGSIQCTACQKSMKNDKQQLMKQEIADLRHSYFIEKSERISLKRQNEQLKQLIEKIIVLFQTLDEGASFKQIQSQMFQLKLQLSEVRQGDKPLISSQSFKYQALTEYVYGDSLRSRSQTERAYVIPQKISNLKCRINTAIQRIQSRNRSNEQNFNSQTVTLDNTRSDSVNSRDKIDKNKELVRKMSERNKLLKSKGANFQQALQKVKFSKQNTQQKVLPIKERIAQRLQKPSIYDRKRSDSLTKYKLLNNQ